MVDDTMALLLLPLPLPAGESPAIVAEEATVGIVLGGDSFGGPLLMPLAIGSVDDDCPGCTVCECGCDDGCSIGGIDVLVFRMLPTVTTDEEPVDDEAEHWDCWRA